MKRKILFITGTRADFGKLKSLITKVEQSSNFESYIFATGMHMLEKYGSTYDEIKKVGFSNIYSFVNQKDSASSDMDFVLSKTIQGLGNHVRKIKPDLIVVHGDRIEALAGAIIGVLNNIRVAHVEGGELSGTVDELIRHSVSKLSHIHFVANKDAKKLLMQMGECEDSIYVIGSPDIDAMMSDNLPSLIKVKEKYDIGFNDYHLFLYHPVTTELHKLKHNINTVIDALILSEFNYVCIYPNNDTGTNVILDALMKLKNNQQFRLIPSMRFEYFISLLKNAQCIIGNSSAGIREASVYGIPTINIGNRQHNRYHYHSIVNVIEDKDMILKSLRNLPIKITPSFHFGKGKSAEKFIKHLSNPQLWDKSIQKQFKSL
ncbi:MAG: UDP-N-acetylglucosamine 2-epimerase [Candidatus Omnitrophica bacterium]|nr:UDP-N-acetylglucosamine 2-epimerase [Candidatus Omnitrophota bacterium]